ncbi:ATP-binding protein [Arenimonas sp.]|uniref:ATP-binding protein n=1 Tax=Arenimonas sp. TaxID=1872635 RepID=UPI0035B33D64
MARVQADELSGFPRRFRGLQFQAMRGTCEDHRRVLAACDNYLETFPRHEAEGTGMLFIGTPGTGKTTMACALSQAVRERYGIGVRYARAADLVELAFDRARSQDNYRAVETADLLVLDELGAEGSHEFPARVLTAVLDRRYADQRPTILVSNLPDLPGETPTLWEHLGAPLSDRVKATMQTLGCAWGSLRHGATGGRNGR